MTFQRDRIQLLIAEIDDVLGKTQKSRLGWLNFGNSTQQRQVLEKVRTNLEKLQQQLASTTTGTPMDGEISPLQALPLKPEDLLLSDRDRQKTPEQILQGVVQEMGYLRTFYERATYTHLRQQYQTDLEILHQQRQTLIEEIKQLEKRKENYTSLTEAGSPQKALEAGSRIEENNNLLSKAPLAQAKTEVGQEQVISSERQNPIAISETLPYAGMELIQEPIEFNQGSTLKAEDNQADPIDFPEADSWEKADRSEDAPQVLTENYWTEDSLINQPTSTDTISALTDLIGSPSLEEKTDNLENTSTFLPASPDEDLLPTLESTTKSNIDFWLGKNMLDQLSEDLSSLEGMGGNEVQEQADTMEVGENREPSSFPASETQPTAQSDRDYNSDQQAQHSSAETETVDPLEPVPALQQEEIPLNIPEEILAEFDDLFGESFDKIDEFGVRDDRSNLPINAERDREQEKKN